MKEQLRIGIIGTGGIARAYARAYHEIPEVKVVGLCDIIPGKAEAFGKREGFPDARCFVRYQDMLDALDLDAVSVSTPNVAHSFIAVDCLSAGKHVLCEKPMSVTLDEAVAMAAASKKYDKLLSIGFQPRYGPAMKTVRDLVRSGILGKIYYVETGSGRRRGIPGGSFIKKEEAGFGAIADIGCYSLDMALNALGYPKPLSATAHSSNYFGKNPAKYGGNWTSDEFEVEDFGTAFIRLENDIVLYFKISWAMNLDTMGDTFFLGTDAGLKCTPAGSCWDGAVGSISIFHDLEGHQTESPIPVDNHGVNLFTAKVRDFVLAVRDGGPAPIPGEQIVRNQAIIDGILRSASSGKEVDIVIPEF